MPKSFDLRGKETQMKERRNSEQMYPVMARYESGELSRRQCCEEYELNEAVFWYWLNKYRKDQEPESSFIKLDIGVVGQKTMELAHPSGGVLRFYGYPNLDYLKALMRP